MLDNCYATILRIFFISTVGNFEYLNYYFFGELFNNYLRICFLLDNYLLMILDK